MGSIYKTMQINSNLHLETYTTWLKMLILPESQETARYGLHSLGKLQEYTEIELPDVGRLYRFIPQVEE